jgi:hypothetical protein
VRIVDLTGLEELRREHRIYRAALDRAVRELGRPVECIPSDVLAIYWAAEVDTTPPEQAGGRGER